METSSDVFDFLDRVMGFEARSKRRPVTEFSAVMEGDLTVQVTSDGCTWFYGKASVHGTIAHYGFNMTK